MKGRRGLIAGVAAAALTACSGNPPSTLDARGPGAARISVMWWVLFALAVAVIVTVTGLMLYGIKRRDRPEGVDDAPGVRLMIGGGVVVPAIVLTILFVLMIRDLGIEAHELRSADVVVDVIGHQWWWEVRYDGGRVVTANEIHIPAGEQVRMNLTTDDVIHSLWVPQLQAKVDMIPGVTNEISVQADEPGTYRGICGEFCGLQHAKMQFLVIADTPADFDAWLKNEARDARSETFGSSDGEMQFFSSTCGACHRIAGTSAEGTSGPDLTHFGSRRTIGAGAMPNTPENLAAWILDPQESKPGNEMPPSPVSPSTLEAIVTYLEGLK